jgi:urea transporter
MSGRAAFWALLGAAVTYEIVAALEHRGDTISEIVWEYWTLRIAAAVLGVHFLLGPRVYERFLSLFIK